MEVGDHDGYTALHRAAEVGFDNGDTIRVLLEAGAKIEAKTTVMVIHRSSVPPIVAPRGMVRHMPFEGRS